MFKLFASLILFATIATAQNNAVQWCDQQTTQTLAITGASSTSPIVITAASSLLTGTQVVITGVLGNTIATVQIDGSSAQVFFEQPRRSATLEEAGRVSLSRAGG